LIFLKFDSAVKGEKITQDIVLKDTLDVSEKFFIANIGSSKFMTALSLLTNDKYNIFKFLCQQNIFISIIY
tara:strand:- start:1698 stop:1910 length:213 start_codon:yes stop_codon:yes gene_type:complete